jgi:hypothetical protein
MPKPSHHLRAARRSGRHTGFLLAVAVGLLITAILVVGNSMGHTQAIPRDNLSKDAHSKCSDTDFSSWFKNDVLQPADSVNFSDGKKEGNCERSLPEALRRPTPSAHRLPKAGHPPCYPAIPADQIATAHTTPRCLERLTFPAPARLARRLLFHSGTQKGMVS